MIARVTDRLPNYILSIFRTAFDTIKIQPEFVAWGGLTRIDRAPRNLHLADPHFAVAINPCFVVETGVPKPVHLLAFSQTIHIQIDELALRRYFKFFVEVDVLEIVPDEDLCHVVRP